MNLQKMSKENPGVISQRRGGASELQEQITAEKELRINPAGTVSVPFRKFPQSLKQPVVSEAGERSQSGLQCRSAFLQRSGESSAAFHRNAACPPPRPGKTTQHSRGVELPSCFHLQAGQVDGKSLCPWQQLLKMSTELLWGRVQGSREEEVLLSYRNKSQQRKNSGLIQQAQ
ncbi:UNVERIFIED_CONTAM: hypothetical protein FKN15_047693 [Acipenser sinensis]